jgi:NADP-dependent 3-hydroxy acid dehydrogenase YdfG
MKKIFISGASRGIGLAIARIFYAAGFQTIICSRNEEKLAQAKAEMPDLHTFVCDVSKKEDIQNLAQTLNKRFGALDILVNNAGIFSMESISEGLEETLENLMQTNFYSAFYLTKGVLPLMVAQKEGTIFNICSISSIQPNKHISLYSVSKYALLGFAKNLREEMKAHNIRVINLLPSSTKTDSWEGTEIPDSRFIAPEDLAKVVFDTYYLSERTVLEEIVIRPMLGDI